MKKTLTSQALLKVYDLHEIYESAQKDKYAVRLDGFNTEGMLLYGVKVVKSNKGNTITIYNTMRHGEYYDEITESEYNHFALNGWRLGVYNVAINNYKSKIEYLTQRIADDNNERPPVTASLQSQLKSTEIKLKKIEQRLWKTIRTKPSAQ